jgi:4-azaleucine resistance transporter AzlC
MQMDASSIMTEPPAARMRSSIVAGARAVLPIAIAAGAFGVSFGILAREAGMGVVAPLVFSLTTFAGSAQFAAVSVLDQGGALAAAVVAAVLLNLRYLAIGVAAAPALRGGRARRLVEAQLVVDESFAVAHRDGQIDRGRFLGAAVVLLAAWTAGTALGVLGGDSLGDPRNYGLDAMFPALFLALLVAQLRSRPAVRAALLGGTIALLLIPVAPAGVPVIAALTGTVVALRPGRA